MIKKIKSLCCVVFIAIISPASGSMNVIDYNTLVNLSNDLSWRIISNNTIVEATKDSWIKNHKYTYSIRNVIGKAIADCITNMGEYKDIDDKRIIDFNIEPENFTAANWNAVVLYNYLNILKHGGDIDDLRNKLGCYFKGYEDKIKKAVSDITQYDKELQISEWMKKFNKYGKIASKDYYDLMRLDTLGSTDKQSIADWMISPLMDIKNASYAGHVAQHPVNKKGNKMPRFIASFIQQYKCDEAYKNKINARIQNANDILNSSSYDYYEPLFDIYLENICAGNEIHTNNTQYNSEYKNHIAISVDDSIYYINQYRFRFVYRKGFELECNFVSSDALESGELDELYRLRTPEELYRKDTELYDNKLHEKYHYQGEIFDKLRIKLIKDDSLRNKIIEYAKKIFI